MTKYRKEKLTKRLIDSLNPDPGGDRLVVRDTEVPGFNLLLLPSGIASYRLQYRTPQGTQREPTLGRHGDLTPDQARKRAYEMRSLISAGRDPLGEKQERLKAATVAEVLDAYLASERFKAKAPSTQSNDRGRIERHLKPLLGRKQVDSLTPREIETARAAIRSGKTAVDVKTRSRGRARVTGGETAASDTIGLFRTILNWAVAEGLAKGNAAAGIRLAPHNTRETILETAADYQRLFKALERLEHEGRIRAQAADAIRVIALTGARKSEITALRWDYVDLKRGLIVLPAAAHKSGRRTGKPRVITLPSAAQAILARQPEAGKDDLVFTPARGDKGPLSLTRPWYLVRREAALPPSLGLHGLRHSLASHLAMGGASASELMTALGHRNLQMVSRYAHFAENSRQALAERAAAPASAGLAAANGDEEAVVVPLDQRGR